MASSRPHNAASFGIGEGTWAAHPRARWGERLGVAVGLLAIWAVHFAVLINKPVHIDDMHYVEAAKYVLEHPLRPFCNTINWKLAPDLAYRDNINPPLYVYVQAAWMWCFGPSIRGLHVLASLFVLLAAAATYAVARRFTGQPMLATALCMLSPTLIPVANLMLDVPAMAIGIASIAAFMRGVAAANHRWSALGGVLVGLATMTKYNSVVLLPLLGLYALWRRRFGHAFWLAIPVVFQALWALHNYVLFEHHEIHILLTMGYREFEKRWLENVLSAGMVPGCSFIFLGVLWLVRARRSDAFWLVPAVFLALFLVLGPRQIDWWSHPEFSKRLEYYVFVGNTVLLVAFALIRGPRRDDVHPAHLAHRRAAETASESPAPRMDELFLWCWAVGVIGFQVLFAYHQSPRYHFLAFPAIAILLMRRLERPAGPSLRLAVLATCVSIVLQVALGLLIARADHLHAVANRDLPSLVKARFGATSPRIFCVGHWGLQYYAQEQGIKCFNAEDVVIRKGDLFIMPHLQSRENMTRVFYRTNARGIAIGLNDALFEQVALKSYPNPLPMSAIDPGVTFLYATVLPAVPYSWRPRVDFIERFLILRAKADYQGKWVRRPEDAPPPQFMPR